jgi:hypothetical protein
VTGVTPVQRTISTIVPTRSLINSAAPTSSLVTTKRLSTFLRSIVEIPNSSYEPVASDVHSPFLESKSTCGLFVICQKSHEQGAAISNGFLSWSRYRSLHNNIIFTTSTKASDQHPLFNSFLFLTSSEDNWGDQVCYQDEFRFPIAKCDRHFPSNIPLSIFHLFLSLLFLIFSLFRRCDVISNLRNIKLYVIIGLNSRGLGFR